MPLPRRRDLNTMQIDWFTVIAQLANFLVLMWLLKRFLYKPILNSIASREQNIADKIASAQAEKIAAQEENTRYKEKNKTFDSHVTDMMNQSKKDADNIRAQLIQDAQNEANTVRSQRIEGLKKEEQNLQQDIIRRTKQEVFSTVVKVLHDLADTDLEKHIHGLFIKHLRNLDVEEKQKLASALGSSSSPVRISSASVLSSVQQEAIGAVVHEVFGIKPDRLHYRRAPELIAGIELVANGHKLAWSIEDYLTTLHHGAEPSLLSTTNIPDRNHVSE